MPLVSMCTSNCKRKHEHGVHCRYYPYIQDFNVYTSPPYTHLFNYNENPELHFSAVSSKTSLAKANNPPLSKRSTVTCPFQITTLVIVIRLLQQWRFCVLAINTHIQRLWHSNNQNKPEEVTHCQLLDNNKLSKCENQMSCSLIPKLEP